MALGFIKKMFSFGKESEAATPVEGETDVRDAVIAEAAVLDAVALAPEEIPSADDMELLPLALLDPVVEAGIDTSGEAVSDLTFAEPAPSSDVPGVEALVPAESAELEDSVPAGHLPHKGGEGTVDAVLTPATDGLTEPATDSPEVFEPGPAASPLSPLVGEMSPEATEGGVATSDSPSTDADRAAPKGFAFAASDTAEAPPEPPAANLTWFQRLRLGLSRTSSQLTGQITALFTKRKLDEQTLQDLEDLLIQADLGIETAMRITDTLSSERYGKEVSGEDVTRIMATEITKVLKPVAKPLQLDLTHKPHVILVVGVNGTGKTTTIGKLAAKLSGAGLKVMLAAGDTFRAAAIEQLKIWADRTGSSFIGTKLGADAAGLAYDAFEQARANKSDVLIIDTAGRLQNKTELMAELEKIVRVLAKLDPDAPHTVLQTLDATTGQNALNQVEIFRNIAGVNGLIMTKLDGTARGGILVAISAKHKLPIYFIGVGEGVDDLEPFEAEDFANAIAGLTH